MVRLKGRESEETVKAFIENVGVAQEVEITRETEL